jgi:hypothetical protein
MIGWAKVSLWESGESEDSNKYSQELFRLLLLLEQTTAA